MMWAVGSALGFLLITAYESSEVEAFTVSRQLEFLCRPRSRPLIVRSLLQKEGHIESVDHRDIAAAAIRKTSAATRREWITSTSGLVSAAAWSRRPSSAHAVATASTVLPSAPRTSSIRSICDPSVSLFRNTSLKRIVYLIGTAHISSDSALLAGRVVRDVRPDAVFVELDAKRVARALPANGFSENKGAYSGNESIAVPSSSSSGATFNSTLNGATIPAKVNPFDFKEKALRASSQLVGNAIKGLYTKLESAGFNVGEEFVIAVREGLAIKAQIILGDRDVEVTLRRLTEALAKTDLKKLLANDSQLEQSMQNFLPQSLKNLNSTSVLTKEQFSTYIETVKTKQNVRQLMSNLQTAAPELYRAMVSERDEYMASGLDTLNQFPSIVAVMGIAHVDGVERSLKERGWSEVLVPYCSVPQRRAQ